MSDNLLNAHATATGILIGQLQAKGEGVFDAAVIAQFTRLMQEHNRMMLIVLKQMEEGAEIFPSQEASDEA